MTTTIEVIDLGLGIIKELTISQIGIEGEVGYDKVYHERIIFIKDLEHNLKTHVDLLLNQMYSLQLEFKTISDEIEKLKFFAEKALNMNTHIPSGKINITNKDNNLVV